jgi:hypothetical protein
MDVKENSGRILTDSLMNYFIIIIHTNYTYITYYMWKGGE